MHKFIADALEILNLNHLEAIKNLLANDNPRVISSLLALDPKLSVDSSINVHTSNIAGLATITAVLADLGYTTSETLKDEHEYQSFVFSAYDDDVQPRSIWLYYQPSTFCRTEFVGYETKQVPIYKKVCEPISDAPVPAPILDEILLS